MRDSKQTAVNFFTFYLNYASELMSQSQIIPGKSLNKRFHVVNKDFYYKEDTKKHSALVNFIENDSLTFFL